MFGVIAKKLFGSKNERYLKKLMPAVDQINSLEDGVKALKDEDFPAMTAKWKQEVENGRDLDEMLPEVFAHVREAGVRSLGMRHYDVQLLGGMVLHNGCISEMKTGEGKTLVATLPAVLNALTGKGMHIVTVNDYLARRDTEWMGKLYGFMGLTTGTVFHGIDDETRKAAYASDITYGTNNEFGFDYLRDNMKFYPEHLVQRPLHYAIVDEVDSILVDEARTPLIISGQADQSTKLYGAVNHEILPQLKKERDFTVDEKGRTVLLTDEGVANCERILNIDNLFDHQNITLQHHILQGLKAHNLFRRDVDYIVKDDQVVIVDEFTGRLMPGRRFSDGLHQALEAKEGVKVEAENQTLASITFQNYFRMYDKLAGMTGTADTEALEFKQIYDLDVVVVPTHQKMIRQDFPDMIYKTQDEKYEAIVDEIVERHKKGQPVLVGTASIESSELVARMLKKKRIAHNVLNAKHHEKEAEIVAEAGQKGKVTIATNMAGRGTDIVLGDGVPDMGGLHIIGTERNESRRIDNQLRGRSGRQGDAGSTRFYLALDDELMRLFGSDRISGLMDKLGMEQGEPIENKMVTKAIEGSQKRVEGHNFEIRKQLLDYDDVMNQQREVIYTQRREFMTEKDLDAVIDDFIEDLSEDILFPVESAKGKEVDQEVLDKVRGRLDEVFNLSKFPEFTDGGIPDRDQVAKWARQNVDGLKAQVGDQGTDIMRYFLLEGLDRHWKEHLLNMDHLRDGIGLRGYGQKDPKHEYKREGFDMFQDMLYRIKEFTMKALTHIRVQAEEVDESKFQHDESDAETGNVQYQGGSTGAAAKPATVRKAPKVRRNAPCPCGSGKKYKKCCGR